MLSVNNGNEEILDFFECSVVGGDLHTIFSANHQRF